MRGSSDHILTSHAGSLPRPDALIEDELLRASDVAGHSFPATSVDWEPVISFKLRLLETAWTNFAAGACPDLRPAYEQFRHDQAHWLDDYALFRALKAHYKGAAYLEWPADLIRRVPRALAQARPRSTWSASRSSCCFVRVSAPEGPRPLQGRAADR